MGSSSLTRDQTQAPALGAWGLSHWSTREVPATSHTLDLLWDAMLCEMLCRNHMDTELRMLNGDLSWSGSYLLTALLCLSLDFSSSRMYTAFWWCWTSNQLAFTLSLYWGELKDLGLRAKANSQRRASPETSQRLHEWSPLCLVGSLILIKRQGGEALGSLAVGQTWLWNQALTTWGSCHSNMAMTKSISWGNLIR